MGIHSNTLNKYLDLARDLGMDITTCTRYDITDELIESVHQRIGIIKDRSNTAPRDVILLPLKDRIEDYPKKDVPGTKIVKILAREDIEISQTSFFRFVKTHLPQYAKSSISVRLPKTKAGIYAQADFGYLGKLWDGTTKKMRRAFAFIMTLVFSRHIYVYITFSQDSDAVIEGCEAAWSYFGGISKIVIVDNCKEKQGRNPISAPGKIG